MKKALAICILCLVLLSCAYAEVLTVGTDLSAEEIRDCYYTYDWVGYNAEYHRYRFFTENLLFSKKRTNLTIMFRRLFRQLPLHHCITYLINHCPVI